MAVEQDGGAELGARAQQQRLELGVIGRVHRADALGGLGQRELALVDRGALRDDARNDAEPGGDALVQAGRADAVDQRRVELGRPAVQVDPGARRGRGEQGRAHPRRGREQPVDQRILRGAQLHGLEPGARQQLGRILVAAVRRVENGARRQAGRLEQAVRRRRHASNLGASAQLCTRFGRAGISRQIPQGRTRRAHARPRPAPCPRICLGLRPARVPPRRGLRPVGRPPIGNAPSGGA